MILSFRTDRSWQMVPRSEEQSDQGLHCLHLLDALLHGKATCSNFRVITAKFSGVQIITNFMV